MPGENISIFQLQEVTEEEITLHLASANSILVEQVLASSHAKQYHYGKYSISKKMATSTENIPNSLSSLVVAPVITAIVILAELMKSVFSFLWNMAMHDVINSIDLGNRAWGPDATE